MMRPLSTMTWPGPLAAGGFAHHRRRDDPRTPHPPGAARSLAEAVDGRARTSWLAEPDDKTPTLVIRLGRVREAHSLLVSNAQSIPYRAGYYTRAAQVEVRINDGPAKVVAMPPDERRPGRLEFERPTAVRKIELRLLWPVAGENPSAGLCEVELIDES